MKRKQIIILSDEDFDALHKASLIMACIMDALGKDGTNAPFSSYDLESIAMRKDHDAAWSAVDFSYPISDGLHTCADKLNEIIVKEGKK